MTLRVQRKACNTCIFRAECSLDIVRLVNDVRETPPANWPKTEEWRFFKGHRVCHHSTDAVCAGFWARYKDQFALGQIAQRMGLVELVDDNVLSDQKGDDPMGNRNRSRGQQRKTRQQTGYEPKWLRDMERFRGAVDAANGRLAPKQYPLQMPGLTVEPRTALITDTSRIPVTRNVLPQARPDPVRKMVPVDAMVTIGGKDLAIPEEDLLAGIAAAMLSGRGQVTAEALAHALLHGPASMHNAQRSFVRNR